MSLIGIAGFLVMPFGIERTLYKPASDIAQELMFQELMFQELMFQELMFQELMFVAIGATWLGHLVRGISKFERKR